MIEKEFVPYEQALALKELGFDERCMGHYWEGLFYYQTTHDHPSTMPNSIESCLAPLYQQAFRWFMEKHQIFGGILSEYSYGGQLHAYHITGKRQSSISKGDFKTYEEAELACLKKLIEIVKNKQNEKHTHTTNR